MKTPRELLLQRHRSVTPRLDAMRRNLLAGVPAATDREAKAGTSFFREFLLPLRWHFAAMSALWVLAALLNTELTPPAASLTARNQSPSPQILTALFENRRQIAEMIDSPTDHFATIPSPHQPAVPRRRSALQPLSVVV